MTTLHGQASRGTPGSIEDGCEEHQCPNSLSAMSITNVSSKPPRSADSDMQSLRKTTSYFRRHKAKASYAEPTSPPIAFSREREDASTGAISQVATKLSGTVTRRRQDPLVSIRNSLFKNRRGREGMGTRSSTRRPASRNSDIDSICTLRDPHDNETFDAGDAIHCHLEKPTVSHPFNFQHLTHAAPTHIPRLDAVHEKDPLSQFWSVAAVQLPTRQPTGTSVTDPDNMEAQFCGSRPSIPRSLKMPGALDVAFERPILAPLPDVSPLDWSYGDTCHATASTMQEPTTPLVLSKPWFGLDVSAPAKIEPAFDHAPEPAAEPEYLHSFWQNLSQSELTIPNGVTFFDSEASSECDLDLAATDTIPSSPSRLLADLTSIEIPAGLTEEDITFRSLQPLPPLPVSKLAESASVVSMTARAVALSPSRARILPIKEPRQYDSTSSLRSSECNSHSASSEMLHQSSSFTDGTWEDDVDFCYEQAAESTCNFNWGPAGRPWPPVLTCRTSCKTYSTHACSPNMDISASTASSKCPIDSPLMDSASNTQPSPDSPGRSRKGSGLRMSSSVDDLAKRRVSTSKGSRGSSVGHRGFLAARKSSADLNSKFYNTPTPLKNLHQTHVTVLSPLCSPMTREEEEETKTSTATTSIKRFCFGAHAMAETCLDGPVPVDYLSDPESNRHSNTNSDSSKHRRSGSFDSCESVNLKRPTTTPIPPPPPTRQADAATSTASQQGLDASPSSLASLHSHASTSRRPKGGPYCLFPRRRSSSSRDLTGAVSERQEDAVRVA